jgi:hypothetical protein
VSDAYTDRIERFLQDTGAQYAWEPTRGDHRRLTVTLGERRHIQIVAKTPSDHRGALNTIQDIRHGLGLVGGKRVGERRERRDRNRSERLEMPSITLLEDKFHARLAAMRFDAPPALPPREAHMERAEATTPLPRGEMTARVRNLLLSGATTDAIMQAGIPGLTRTNVNGVRSVLMKEGRVQSVVPGVRRKHAKARREAQKLARQAETPVVAATVVPTPIGKPPVRIDWRDRLLFGGQMAAILGMLAVGLYYL